MNGRKSFYWADILAILFIGAVTAALFIWMKKFIQATNRWPYPMGFLKLLILGTFGSMIKARFKTGSYWEIPQFFWNAIVWGIWGIWFTWAFPFCSAGTESLMKSNLWPNWDWLFWKAFSKSLSICFLSGYAYFMMLSHEFISFWLKRKELYLYPTEPYRVLFLKNGISSKFWGDYIPKTILFFWLPAHTITFLLPATFRVIMAAYLAVVLAFFISFGKK